jgi:hypothetical protein
MPANPLEQAVHSGIRMNGRIGDLLARIGNEAHPRGDLTTDYRNARRSLELVLQQDNPLDDVRDILRNLERQLRADLAAIFVYAMSLGRQEAERQLQFYNVRPDALDSITLTTQTQSAQDAVMSRFDAQKAAIIALLLMGASAAQIIGEAERVGVFSAAEFTNVASYWSTRLVWDSFDNSLFNTAKRFNYQKVAVAVLDERTTDCCLKVHGQVVPFRDKFHLTGTPRFADHMSWPAFHWYCRTSIAVYQSGFDDGITKKMTDEAAVILAARGAGKKANPATS